MNLDISPSLDLPKLAENRESVNRESIMSRKLVGQDTSLGIETRPPGTYIWAVRLAGLWG